MIFTEGKCKFLDQSETWCTLHGRKCSSSLCIYKINNDLLIKSTKEIYEK